MKRTETGLKRLFLPMLCALLCLLLYAVAAASGVETDEDGGIWDYDNGTYTDPGGNVYTITPGGVEDDGGSATVTNDDGSITVVTGDKDPVITNDDGSITVESGQIQIQTEEPTRAPITGEDWDALLSSVAARNGSETLTVWTDPATGNTVQVSVKYMGIGRSMIELNGQEIMVNTVDLKWQTDAPEDKVLATVDAPRVGYAWLRKAPSNSIKNAKLLQIRTGSVLRVISTGDNWTLVDYEGLRGYVQTSSLEFYLNDHTDFETGFVSLKGKITGKETVHARSRDKGCRDLGEYRLGTPVAVFDIIDEWAEVDIGGWHCRILAQYVTLEKELASAQ